VLEGEGLKFTEGRGGTGGCPEGEGSEESNQRRALKDYQSTEKRRLVAEICVLKRTFIGPSLGKNYEKIGGGDITI